MSKFTQAQVVDVLQLQQLVMDWGYELDANGGADVAAFCTADCDYLVGGKLHKGQDAVRAFYAARNERVRTQQRDGARTQRHTITNVRVDFADADSAALTFVLVNYSAEGPAPALDLVGPTIIADCAVACRRDAGDWRISRFDSTPVFIGNDPFLNASVVPK